MINALRMIYAIWLKPMNADVHISEPKFIEMANAELEIPMSECHLKNIALYCSLLLPESILKAMIDPTKPQIWTTFLNCWFVKVMQPVVSSPFSFLPDVFIKLFVFLIGTLETVKLVD